LRQPTATGRCRPGATTITPSRSSGRACWRRWRHSWRGRRQDDRPAPAQPTHTSSHTWEYQRSRLPWPETVQTKPRHALRNGAYNAAVAEVAVNRATGKVRVTRFMIGQDNGLTINPRGEADHGGRSHPNGEQDAAGGGDVRSVECDEHRLEHVPDPDLRGRTRDRDCLDRPAGDTSHGRR